MNRGGWIPFIASIAIFILLEVASLSMMSRNAPLQRTWIAGGAHTLSGTVWGMTRGVSSFFGLKKENAALVQENHLLMKEVLDARNALREAGIGSTAVAGRRGYEYISAEVVKMSSHKQHNYLILNRGYEDGVKEKSGVLTSRGVIGIIDAVSAHYSYAFSFQNSEVSISARMGKEGAMGPLVWDGIHSDMAILKEIPLQFKYHPGDTVYTSGNSMLFPPDIPLGTAGSAQIVNGATNEIQVRLFQDFTSIRYVTVVHNRAFDEIEQFEL